MTCSLIITTYNWPEALELSILSVFRQSTLPLEIIIADDGSTEETEKLIQKMQSFSPVPLIHSWQEDNGFRAAASRNKAISKTTSDYIILIDGDIILHKDFIKEHKQNAKKDYFIQGSRVLINEEKSKEVLEQKQVNFTFFDSGLQNRKNTIHCNILTKIFSNKRDTLKGIKTCNMSFYKSDCLEVNGFNEDFVGWGREDSEFVVRLFNKGIHRQNIRFNCLAYHIWHNENTRDSLKVNDEILDTAIQNKLQWCKNGINMHLK